MKIPPGMTEQEVTEIIVRVIKTLSSKFRFGYYSKEDMEQEGFIFAINLLNSDKYDSSRKLENLLYSHIRYRFINYKRDNYSRSESPCKNCVFYDPKTKDKTCGAFTDVKHCNKLEGWKKRNASRKSLMYPKDISVVTKHPESASNHVEDVDFSEMKDYINENLPAELRSDYLRMLEGVNIPKARRGRVREAILSILNKRGDNTHEK